MKHLRDLRDVEVAGREQRDPFATLVEADRRSRPLTDHGFGSADEGHAVERPRRTLMDWEARGLGIEYEL
jgi:hypothetical protein